MKSTMQRRALLGALALIIAGAGLPGCSRKPATQPVPAGATVLALGDSLTSGVGASADTAYPTLLAARTGWNVINAGVSGNTSAQALERLPALLQENSHRVLTSLKAYSDVCELCGQVAVCGLKLCATDCGLVVRLSH